MTTSWSEKLLQQVCDCCREHRFCSHHRSLRWKFESFSHMHHHHRRRVAQALYHHDCVRNENPVVYDTSPFVHIKVCPLSVRHRKTSQSFGFFFFFSVANNDIQYQYPHCFESFPDKEPIAGSLTSSFEHYYFLFRIHSDWSHGSLNKFRNQPNLNHSF